MNLRFEIYFYFKSQIANQFSIKNGFKIPIEMKKTFILIIAALLLIF